MLNYLLFFSTWKSRLIVSHKPFIKDIVTIWYQVFVIWGIYWDWSISHWRQLPDKYKADVVTWWHNENKCQDHLHTSLHPRHLAPKLLVSSGKIGKHFTWKIFDAIQILGKNCKDPWQSQLYLESKWISLADYLDCHLGLVLAFYHSIV